MEGDETQGKADVGAAAMALRPRTSTIGESSPDWDGGLEGHCQLPQNQNGGSFPRHYDRLQTL